MTETEESLIRQEIRDMAKQGSVSWEQFDKTPMNSYERNFIIESLTTNALITHSAHMMRHVTTPPGEYPTTYEETIVNVLFPLVCRRLSLCEEQLWKYHAQSNS